MRLKFLFVSILYLLILEVGFVTLSYADPPLIKIIQEQHSQKDSQQKVDTSLLKNEIRWGERAVVYTLEPVKHPDSAGLVDMIFSFRIKDDFCQSCQCCNEIHIEVLTKNGLEYLGPKQWIAYPSQDKDRFFSANLQINLPHNDTSSLRLELNFGQSKVPAVVYFVTANDSVEFWKGYPSGRYWKYSKPEPDTMKFDIRIDLRNPSHYEIIKHFEDSLEPMRSTSESGFYIIKVTRYDFDKLKREGFKCEYIKEPPPKEKKQNNKVKVQDKKIGDKHGQSHPKPDCDKRDDEASIWLDYIDGEDQYGRLHSNYLIRFLLGYANYTNDDVFAITNGFRIYSPDGATWGSTYWDTLSTLAWGNAFDFWFDAYGFGITGTGADSIKFLGVTMFGTGLPDNFDDTAVSVMIGPIPPEDVGKTICIDSSYVGGSDNWKWSSSDGSTSYQPTWYGPTCFEITTPGYIYYSGQLRYIDPTPPDTVYKPIRNATIYMWDEDMWGYIQFLDSAVTDNGGYFYIGPVSNDDEWGLFGQDVFFSFYAMNDGAYVTDSDTLDSPVQMIITETIDDVSNGDHELEQPLTINESKPFFVADIIFDGYKKWKQLRPDSEDHPWGPVKVVLNSSTENACYYPADRYIYLNDSIDNVERWPNTWNRSTILHEYAHRLSYMKLFFLQGGGSHTLYSIIPIGTASSEGWAHFWSAYVMGSDISVRYWNNFFDSTWFSLENGEFDLVPYTGSANAMGKYNETAVAGIFWDIYDDNIDDYSCYSNWGDTSTPHSFDGIGDTLSNGIANILDVLLNRTVNGHQPDNIDEFWEAWFQPEISLGHGNAMEDIWYEHGEIMSCCILRGDVAIPKDGIVLVNDIVWIVGFLFKGGTPPQCEEEADANNDNDVNVADVVYIVDFLFRGGAPIVPCP